MTGSTHPHRASTFRLVPATALLYTLWAWVPNAPHPLPGGTVRPADATALAQLPADTPFLIEGHVHLADGVVARPWQDREIHLQRKRIDHGGRGGTSRHQVVATIASQRPALHFHWNTTRIPIAADSYRLDHAPRIESQWNDGWDRSSRGLREGDAALALGRTGRDGRYWIESLLETPLEAVQADIHHEHRIRMRVTLAAKIIATLLVLSWLSPLWGGGRRRRQPTVS